MSLPLSGGTWQISGSLSWPGSPGRGSHSTWPSPGLTSPHLQTCPTHLSCQMASVHCQEIWSELTQFPRSPCQVHQPHQDCCFSHKTKESSKFVLIWVSWRDFHHRSIIHWRKWIWSKCSENISAFRRIQFSGGIRKISASEITHEMMGAWL